MRVTSVIMSDSSLPENTPKKTHTHTSIRTYAPVHTHTHAVSYKGIHKCWHEQLHVYKQTHDRVFHLWKHTCTHTTHTLCVWQMKTCCFASAFWLLAEFWWNCTAEWAQFWTQMTAHIGEHVHSYSRFIKNTTETTQGKRNAAADTSRLKMLTHQRFPCYKTHKNNIFLTENLSVYRNIFSSLQNKLGHQASE